MYGRHTLALSSVLVGWAGAVVAQTAAQDPWTRAPAMPTTYYSDDGFIDRVNQEYAAVNSDIDREGGWEFKNAADLAQFTALLQQENADYEKICAPFLIRKAR